MMSDQLPEGWVWVRIKDVISQISLTNRKLHQRDYLDGGSYPVVDQGQKLIGGYTDQDLLVPCELPVIVFGDHTKAIKFIDFPFVAGADGIKVIKPDKVFFAKLFYYFLFAIELPNKGYARHFQYLEKEFIPLPPLAEQERIVAKIEALFSQLDAGVAALRRIQAALKRYKASVLKAACEGRLVGQDPTDEPAEALLRRLGKAPLVDDDLPALPEGWCWVRVGEVAEINPKDALIRTLPDSLPVSFVPMAAVDAYLGIVLNPEEQPLGKVRKGYTQFSNGDVLFAKITPCMENGKAAIAYDLLNNRGFGSTEFHVLRPCKAVNAQWLFHFIRQERFRSEAKAHFTGTAGQLRVPITFLSNYQMPLPPLIEQQRIVVEIEHRLSIIVEVESIVSALLARSARLRQAILKQAFEGKLV